MIWGMVCHQMMHLLQAQTCCPERPPLGTMVASPEQHAGQSKPCSGSAAVDLAQNTRQAPLKFQRSLKAWSGMLGPQVRPSSVFTGGATS